MEDRIDIKKNSEEQISDGSEKICKYCSVNDGVWKFVHSDEMMCDGCYTWHVKSNPGTIDNFDINEWTNIKTQIGDVGKIDFTNVLVKSREGLRKVCKFCNVYGGVWKCVHSDEMMCDGCYTWHVKSNPGTIEDFNIEEWQNIKTEIRDDEKGDDVSNVMVQSREKLERKCKYCSLQDGVWKCVQNDEMVCEKCYRLHVKCNNGQEKRFYKNDWTKLNKENQDTLNHKDSKNENVIAENIENRKDNDVPNIISKLKLTLEKCLDTEKTVTETSNDFTQSVSAIMQTVYSRTADLTCKIDQTTDEIIRMLQRLNQHNREKMAQLELKLHKEIYDIKAAMQGFEDKEKNQDTDLVHKTTEYICSKCRWSDKDKQNSQESHKSDGLQIEQTVSRDNRLDTSHSSDSLQTSEICKNNVTATMYVQDRHKSFSNKKRIQESDENTSVALVDEQEFKETFTSLHVTKTEENELDTSKDNEPMIDEQNIKETFTSQYIEKTEENELDTSKDNVAMIDEQESKETFNSQYVEKTEENKLDTSKDSIASSSSLLQPKSESKTITIHIKESLHTLESTGENKINADTNELDSKASTSSYLFQTSESKQDVKVVERQHVIQDVQSLPSTEQSQIDSDVDERNNQISVTESESNRSLPLDFDGNDILPIESNDNKPLSSIYKLLLPKKSSPVDVKLSPEPEIKTDSKSTIADEQTISLGRITDKSTVTKDQYADTFENRSQTSLSGDIIKKSSLDETDSFPQIKYNHSSSSEHLKSSTEVSIAIPHPPPSPPSDEKKSGKERNDRHARFIQFPHPPQKNKYSSGEHLASETNVIYSFTLKDNRSRVVAIDNGQAWLWSCSKSVLTSVSSDGRILENIAAEFLVYDVAAAGPGELLVTRSDGKTVMRMLANRKFTSAYKAPFGYTTRGITVKNNGNIIVVLYRYRGSKLVEVNSNGEVIKSFESYDVRNAKKLFINPYIICTNINDDVIVSEEEKVVCVTSNGCWRFTYTIPAKSFKAAFNPVYIVTDKFGHIIISDFNNSVLHLLDEDGKFIRYVMTETQGCNKPAGLSIDPSGKLWVCCTGENKIFILKYLCKINI